MTDNDSRENGTSESTSITPVNRRRFLAASSTAVAGLAGCLGGGGGGGGDGEDGGDGGDGGTPTDSMGTTVGGDGKPYEGETLTAAVWSGSDLWLGAYTDHIIPEFEEKTGAEVKMETVWSGIVSKIKSSPEDNPPYDTTVSDIYVGYNGQQAGLWEDIRYDNIPNYEDVYQFLKDFRDDSQGVPVSGMPMGILYRADSDFKPETWSDFGTPEGQEAATAQEGSWYAYPSHIAAIAMDDLPLADEHYEEEYHKAVFDTLNSWNTDSWYAGGAEFWNLIRNGVIDASGYYMNTHRDAQDDDEIEFAYPTEGSIWYWDHFRVVRGTDKRRLAEEWINHLLDPEIQKYRAEQQYNAAANKTIRYDRDILADNYPTSDEEWENEAAFFQVPYLPNHWEKFNGWFKQIKTGSYESG